MKPLDKTDFPIVIYDDEDFLDLEDEFEEEFEEEFDEEEGQMTWFSSASHLPPCLGERLPCTV